MLARDLKPTDVFFFNGKVEKIRFVYKGIKVVGEIPHVEIHFISGSSIVLPENMIIGGYGRNFDEEE